MRSRTASSLFSACAAALAATVAGCGGGSPLPRAAAPAMPAAQAKCTIAASQENPLVTEWPASEKANLESLLLRGSGGGGVAVAYAGCSMRLLPQCRVPGQYHWKRTTTATDTIEIRDEDELYAKLPLGAVSLEGELQRSGRIAVSTTVGGQLELRGFAPQSLRAEGACAGATHVMGALSVGTFKLRSGGALSARAGASVPIVGEASGATRSEETVMREAGDPASCKAATDESPPVECRSPIQVFLWPLPKPPSEIGPPGTVKVGFYSGDSDKTWNVLLGEQKLCTTPCTRWIDPAATFGMQTPKGGFFQPVHGVEVPDLRAYGPEGPLQVRAYGSRFGPMAGGIVLTTFAGLGTAAGIALTAAGCALEEEGVCKAGLITLPISALALAGGIWIVMESGAEAKVTGPNAIPAARRERPLLLGVGGAF